MRFNQECIFTPVSTQQGPVQAFVPAPHGILGHEQRLYGAQGQLLPVGYHSGAEYPRAGPSDSSQYSSLPNLSQHQHQQHHMNGNLSYMPHDDRGHSSSTPGPGHRSDSVYGTDRRRSDDYTHHYPPPSPSSHLPAPLGHAYAPSKNGSSNYSMSSYGGASESYNNIQPLHHGRPSSQRQDSPGSHRSSSGEHNSVSPQPHQTYHPPIASHRRDRETSSGPSSPGGQIPSMQIADLIDQPQGRLHQRSAADGDMLNRLNFRTGL